tara:strand:- start:1288 stop:2856 length:1569 start_codon:yes stop_codon:yes gene_type:complete
MIRLSFLIVWLGSTVSVWSQITFQDLTDDAGIRQPLAGLMGHGGAWGDVDGDGWIDLFVGGFADRPDEEYAPANGPVISQLFRNVQGKTFEPVLETPVRHYARTSGALFADLDNDGDVDLYVANNSKGKSKRDAEPQRSAQMAGSKLFRNDGANFVDVSNSSGACPERLGTARNVGVLDFNRDGLLDLLVVEDRFRKGPSSRLFRNLGGLKFEDATASCGIPEDVFGLGLALADVNADGATDVFVPHSNRFFLGSPDGTFRECTEELTSVLGWEPLDGEDWPCGAQFADLNRDGKPDLVLSLHSVRARNRVFLNEGANENGVPRFREITRQAGIPDEIAARCPHVEVQDFDNDGWPDIYLSAGWLTKEGRLTPMIFRHQGTKEPSFQPPANPPGELVYFPAGPSGDYDNDGRRDLFLINWFPGNWSRLLRNETEGGNWLQIRVAGKTFNRMGIGAKVRVFDDDALIGYQEVSVGYGYASGQTNWLHFGLGDRESVAVSVELPNGETIHNARIAANQRLTLSE